MVTYVVRVGVGSYNVRVDVGSFSEDMHVVIESYIYSY